MTFNGIADLYLVNECGQRCLEYRFGFFLVIIYSRKNVKLHDDCQVVDVQTVIDFFSCPVGVGGSLESQNFINYKQRKHAQIINIITPQVDATVKKMYF